MRNLLRVLWLLSLLCFAVAPIVGENVAQLPKPTGYVDDYAGVFSTDAKAQMEALCVELHDKAKAQAFVVTVKTLGGAPIESFANDLFHTWGIGDKKTDRGVMLLIATQDHKYRIEVGYGLEGILNDAKVGDMGRAMVPDLQANNYDAAARSGLSAIAKIVADDAHVTLDSLGAVSAPATSPGSSPAPAAGDASGNGILYILGGFFVVGIVLLVLLARVAGKRGWKSGGFRSGGGGGGGGGFSGGGGGDSGGGGASGSW
jgi:uncharacterized protein